MRFKPLIVVLATAAALVGCGSDNERNAPTGNGGPSTSAASGGGAVPDPCTLVTKAEAEAAMNSPVQDGVASTTGDGKVCVFSAGVGSVTITTFAGKEFDVLRDANKAAYGDKFTDIADLGDKAYSTPAAVFVLKGGVGFRFSIIGLVDSATAHLITLAKAAVARA